MTGPQGQKRGWADSFNMKTPHFGVYSLAANILTSGLVAQEPAVANPVPQAPAKKDDVGISSRDGISISGVDVLVTRNGRTEKLTKEMVLDNGFRVRLDGTVVAKDGGVVTLRPTQTLTFDGRFVTYPIVESVAPKTPVVVGPAPTPVKPAATPMPKPPRQGPIKAGEGVQK